MLFLLGLGGIAGAMKSLGVAIALLGTFYAIYRVGVLNESPKEVAFVLFIAILFFVSIFIVFK